jgi:tricorn protease
MDKKGARRIKGDDGSTVYFLSDRDGPTTLYAYDLNAKEVKRLFDSNIDIKSASACADAIAFDRIDGLYLFDLATRNAAKLDVTVRGDLAGVRPRLEKVGKNVQHVKLSPTGARVVLEARGDVLTVPAEKGDSRNLTSTPGVADRDPSWSPDGQTVAYFSDSSGEYALHLRAQNGLGEVKTYPLGDPPSFYYEPTWSPDGKRIAYSDKRRNLWVLDLESGKSTKVDTNPQLRDQLKPSWSPDGKWIAYARGLHALPSAVFLYSIETGETHQITDGMSDVQAVDFDKGGKHLYFTASTDFGPLAAGSMASFNRAQTSSAYLIVLDKRDPSPLAPESDDEKSASESKTPEKDQEKKSGDDKEHGKRELLPVTIDLENIDQRIVPLPLPNRNYTGLIAGKPGVVYLLEGDPVFRANRAGQPESFSVLRFDLKKRKPEKLVDGATQFTLSLDGEKMLYRLGPDKWFLTASASPAKPGEGAIKLEELEVRVEPRAEWEQIYRETWRIERDFLYDPHAHGLDLAYAQQRYAKYVAGLGSRYDLSVLMEEMLGELCLGHVYVAGGDMPSETKDPKTGLLGADYAVENGHYKFTKIYRGEGWNPDLRAPLLQPGAGVNEGEYLLAVNGREVRADESVYEHFDGTADKQTTIRVGPNADGTGARDVTVVPIPNERQLRNLAWVEANRKKVDQLSGGKVAYIYLPNTSTEGFARFNRYFFAQTDKQAAVIDERFNGGGQLADHIIDYLSQPLRDYLTGREGEGDDQPFPRGAIRGPKVMIINERAGSGGDYLPYTFRQANLGPLVGKRTWGGLVGIGGYPTLIDGGTVTAPRMGIWFPNGRWDVENRGVSPDVEVEFDPQLVRQGKDPQLEKAVAVALELLEKNPTHEPKRPAFPNYYRAGIQEPAEGK